MAFEMKLPELGENIEGGTIVQILVEVGDTIAADQPVLELETGKATLEVPATAAGTVESMLVKEGDSLKIGDAILSLIQGADSAAPGPEQTETKKSEEVPATPVKPATEEKPARLQGNSTTIVLPELGENIEEGDVVQVMVRVGESIVREQPLLELETGKATLEVPSPAAGIVEELKMNVGDHIKIGDPILVVKGEKSETAEPEKTNLAPEREDVKKEQTATADKETTPASPQTVPGRPLPDHVPVRAAPSVRKFAREIGISLEEVPGAQAGERITIEAVKKYSKTINENRSSAPVAATAGFPAAKLPDFSQWGDVERLPMSQIRKATADHMAYCWATVPHVTQHDTADVTELEALRKRFAPRAEAAGGKLTLTAIIIKIVAAALKVHPKFAASIDMQTHDILYKRYYNLGVAVDTEKGLMVPVLKNVDKKNIIQISMELSELATKAREGKISPADLAGGTFTITNLGGIGGSFFTPIVNAPEVAILGIGRSSQISVCPKDGKPCQHESKLPLSLSYDHRLIDGADGARFLRWVVEAIEEPLLISLEG